MSVNLIILFGAQDIQGGKEMEVFELPELIELSDFGGNFDTYLSAVYKIFKNDFIKNKPVFQGKRLGLKKFPLIEGKEYTFYHMTHEGNIENERLPDLRRMERIAWPRPMIDYSTHSYLKVWRNIRRGKGGTRNRILILHEKEKYLVVLEERTNYILPWTAYLIKRSHQLGKHLKEYDSYNKQKPPQK
ncbi:MAG TPA: hypothetical protein VJ896_09370 [Bacteroidales bacterium]|nr:hypothetical protein [Bacteroidales bacterium]